MIAALSVIMLVAVCGVFSVSAQNSLSEGFESGSKTAYADGSVTLSARAVGFFPIL